MHSASNERGGTARNGRQRANRRPRNFVVSPHARAPSQPFPPPPSSPLPLFQDVGFGWTGPGPLATDVAVINRYFDEFYPAALRVAAALRERGG